MIPAIAGNKYITFLKIFSKITILTSFTGLNWVEESRYLPVFYLNLVLVNIHVYMNLYQNPSERLQDTRRKI